MSFMLIFVLIANILIVFMANVVMLRVMAPGKGSWEKILRENGHLKDEVFV